MARGIKIVKKTVAGESVYIRSLSGDENAPRIVELMYLVGSQPELMVEFGSLLVAGCLCDANGRLEFESREDAAKNCSIGFLTAFIEPALDVSGLEADAKALKKNKSPVRDFQFALALELGYYDPDKMLEGSPASLLLEWMDYSKRHPFGGTLSCIQTALSCLTFAQGSGMKRRGGGGELKLKDFILEFDKSPEQTKLNPMDALPLLQKRYGKSNSNTGNKPHGKNGQL